MAVLFHRFSPGWLPGGKRVRGARWKVWGETEMLFSGPGILPTEDTSAAASLCKERPARHCLWGSLRRLLFRGWWVAMRPVLQQLYSQDIFLFVGMTPPPPQRKVCLKRKKQRYNSLVLLRAVLNRIGKTLLNHSWRTFSHEI